MSKPAFAPKRVLISTGELFRHIQGANMVFLEIAEYFLSLGCEVVIYSNLALPPMLDEAHKLVRNDLLYVVNDPEECVGVDFDLIFMHDNVLPDCIIDALAKGLKARIVSMRLSAFVSIEMPLFPKIENNISDVIGIISVEAELEMIKRGLDKKKCWVMENFTSQSMISPNIASREKLTSVLITSNHAPDEVVDAAAILKNKGIHVEHFGEGGDKVQRLDKTILQKFDAIITVGKTVQYGLALGIPVYVYDHFGGEGWLSDKNFENEIAYNFSGRATKQKKTAEQISDEICNNYTLARRYVIANQYQFQKRFAISNKINDLMLKMSKNAKRKRITTEEALAWKSFTNLYRGLYRTQEYYKDQLHVLSRGGTLGANKDKDPI